MRKLATTLLALAVLPAVALAQSPAYLYHGSLNNWASGGIATTSTRTAAQTGGAYNTRVFTFRAAFSGSNFYKLYSVSENFDNDFNNPGGQKVWSGSLAIGAAGTAFAYGDGNGGAGSFPVVVNKYYTYTVQDVTNGTNAAALVQETDNAPVTVASMTDNGSTRLPEETLDITVTTSAAKSPQERVFVRYTTDGASYTNVETTCTGATCTVSLAASIAEDPGAGNSYSAFVTTLDPNAPRSVKGDDAAAAFGGQGVMAVDPALSYTAVSSGSNTFAPSSLPVELVSFTGLGSTNAARLAWTTASETNNAGFYIEQQMGDAWNTVSSLVAGRGTTTERSDYAYTVDGLTAGTYTFRLRQVDTDGSVQYSPNVSVEVGVEGDGRLTLLGQRAVRIETNDAQAVTVRVFDVLGRAVSSMAVAVDGTAVVELPGLASGAYVVRVEGERFASTKTLVVR